MERAALTRPGRGGSWQAARAGARAGGALFLRRPHPPPQRRSSPRSSSPRAPHAVGWSERGVSGGQASGCTPWRPSTPSPPTLSLPGQLSSSYARARTHTRSACPQLSGLRPS
eukprot:1287010-Rhodomonas_salina.2